MSLGQILIFVLIVLLVLWLFTGRTVFGGDEHEDIEGGGRQKLDWPFGESDKVLKLGMERFKDLKDGKMKKDVRIWREKKFAEWKAGDEVNVWNNDPHLTEPETFKVKLAKIEHLKGDDLEKLKKKLKDFHEADLTWMDRKSDEIKENGLVVISFA